MLDFVAAGLALARTARDSPAAPTARRAADAGQRPALAAESRSACCEKYTQIFVLRNRNDEAAVAELVALFHGTASVLLRHEIAYTLGQMQRVDAVPFLERLLADRAEDPITRHEAAEALGAIEAPESLSVLAKHAADDASEAAGGGPAAADADADASSAACPWQPAPPEPTAPTYTYVSPAPAAEAAPLPELRARLLDRGAPLFERYRALFALRDAVPREGAGAVAALCECLGRAGGESALLKHEVAFVLGQLEHPAAGDALCGAVRREGEHGMVRHEAAEALGAIGTPQAVETLRAYCGHAEEILRESCWVALMWLED
ncbi:hypothetical protein EMIHUDRAFT_64969 [Emiliania huxleyi CCMP1516]|uniref:Deoxyhypusine monooxygenase n=2 Tax=Emiliania huxleyi TaxID=2903 RepID=A0A0D3ISP0_EMIH1|nr:hypothetical protein EMIHUDRAFT_76411 [Emiliania huxleyi CCMP1516]XP_005776399.1 hypothetical protein EMIHUDRAFT_64969 [Emiliania huxleyi CCMP1516]EOD14275.1 hypothetical protein EMIHUDRAFT_76411 [Emiliania huxleyi CCMP1516]EOD23970.1 hypothetical protein EMIHUDRAFT_64969 [Emiliania huxleyi CCMP1516]|eukprot:XP_005766704.1 hypothetical protein EMIHUDRAFT_76411 [Emiliania huxleyi CCMP1516]